jgi:hypothetical protein
MSSTEWAKHFGANVDDDMEGIGGCTVVILEKEKIAKYDKFKNILSLR